MTSKVVLLLSAACFHAFQASNPAAPPEIADKGKAICDCVGPESRHQGATDAVIQKEAKNIEADPKYKIQNKHVLNAMQYCSLKVLDTD